MKVNERRTVVGGLIGHCVSPQPWREIDAHGHMGSHVSVTCRPCVSTRVNAPHLNHSQTDLYSIYLPRRDGRLS